jgi:hypothetical protein
LAFGSAVHFAWLLYIVLYIPPSVTASRLWKWFTYLSRKNNMNFLCKFSFLNIILNSSYFFLVLIFGKSLLHWEENTCFYSLIRTKLISHPHVLSPTCLTLNGLLFQAAVLLGGEISGELSKKRNNYFNF